MKWKREFFLVALAAWIMGLAALSSVALSAGAQQAPDGEEPPPEEPIASYLPTLYNDFCGGTFFDDFSDPSSGWPVGADQFVQYGYADGEYQVLGEQFDIIYWFQAPTCQRQFFHMAVKARWAGESGRTYGLLFGMPTDSFSPSYFFDVSSDGQWFRLRQHGADGLKSIIPQTPAPTAILTGTATNLLEITVETMTMTLAINGSVVATQAVSTVLTDTYGHVALAVQPQPGISSKAVARFDNFRVTTLSGGAATAPQVAWLHDPAWRSDD